MSLPSIPTVVDTEIHLPAPFERLRDVAYNLWWSWSPEAYQVFERLDPLPWRSQPNPVEMLHELQPDRWDEMLADRSFHEAYRRMVDAFDRYVRGGGDAWFGRRYPDYAAGPLAYFSTEFGWHESMQVYSGGLGVLSGDHCKSASDLGLPFVGVGLMYHRGYFRQTIDPDGQQQHFYPHTHPTLLPMHRVADAGGHELHVSVGLPGRDVTLRAWRVDVGRIPVLLLDTDVPDNRSADRTLTSILYIRGRETRLCQEILLGIGGVRLLDALGIRPAVWHLNEGHSSFLSLERIERALASGEADDLDQAIAGCRQNAVFTTHTPVKAGNERFERDLVRRYFGPWCERTGVDPDRLDALGRAWEDDDGFNLTALAIRTSSRTNGVSALHGEVADGIWRHLLEGEGRKIESITNGVHSPTWIGPEIYALLARQLGPDFLLHLEDPRFPAAVAEIPDNEIWEAHQQQKRRLIRFVRKRVMDQYARHGRPPEELHVVQTSLLDPERLTIGFARRFATYKRADLLFRDPERLQRIVADAERPLQILLAGKAHPADRPGQDLIRRIVEMTARPEFAGRVQFIEDYDIRVGRFLAQGVDLWLNTPRRPKEASGTSGMKIAANGGLNCSILDGWWCEGYDPAHGWAIGDAGESDDDRDADALYRLLADEIAPAFYERGEDGVPAAWAARMKRALGDLTPRFSASRMVREYAERYYVPLAQS